MANDTRVRPPEMDERPLYIGPTVNAYVQCGYNFISYCDDDQYCCADNSSCCDYIGLSIGAIIGIVGGSIAGLSLLCSVIVCVCKVVNKKKLNPMPQGGLPQVNQHGQQIGMHPQQFGQQPPYYGMQQSFVGHTPHPQQPRQMFVPTQAQGKQMVSSIEGIEHEELAGSQGGRCIVSVSKGEPRSVASPLPNYVS